MDPNHFSDDDVAPRDADSYVSEEVDEGDDGLDVEDDDPEHENSLPDATIEEVYEENFGATGLMQTYSRKHDSPDSEWIRMPLPDRFFLPLNTYEIDEEAEPVGDEANAQPSAVLVPEERVTSTEQRVAEYTAPNSEGKFHGTSAKSKMANAMLHHQVILIQLPEKDMNKKSALELLAATFPEHAALFTNGTFAVGYLGRDPVGCAALDLGSNEGAAATVLSSLRRAQTLPFASPEQAFRLSTNPTEAGAVPEDEINPFLKWNRVQGDCELAKPSEGAPVAATAVAVNGRNKRKQTHIVRDHVRLKRAIEEAGGLDKVIFVALDCECAIVRRDAMAVPLEIAFVGHSTEEDHNYHTFVHPTGLWPEEESTASRLSACTGHTGHGIPFKDADELLSRDYRRIHRRIEDIVDSQDRRVIVIKKGEGMEDIHCLRWVSGAADFADYLDEPRDFHPKAYSVATLAKVLGLDTTAADAAFKPNEIESVREYAQKHGHRHFSEDDEPVPLCAYHCRARQYLPDCHCALMDGYLLLQRIDGLVKEAKEKAGECEQKQ